MTEYNRIVRVVVVDDEPIILASIKQILKDHPAIRIVGTGANGVEAMQLVNRLRPDLIVLDVNMPLLDGIETAAGLAQAFPAMKILMLTLTESSDLLKRALRAGAHDHLSKGEELLELPAAILRLAQRTVPTSPSRGLGFVWTFHGTKGNSGTTTLAVNTAVALGQAGHRVLLVDLDIDAGDCEFALDLKPLLGPRAMAGSYEAGCSRILDCLQQVPLQAGSPDRVLHVLGGACLLELQQAADSTMLTTLMTLLITRFDYILVDLPPGRILEDRHAGLLEVSERIFMVENSDITSLRGVAALLRTLSRAKYAMRKISLFLSSLITDDRHNLELFEALLADLKEVREIPRDDSGCQSALRAGRSLLLLPPGPGPGLAEFIRSMVSEDVSGGVPQREPRGLWNRLRVGVERAMGRPIQPAA